MGEYEAFWSVIGQIAATLALVVGIIEGVKKIHKVMPSAKLEERVGSLEEKSQKDYEHLKKHDTELQALREKTDTTNEQLRLVNDGIQRIGKSQIALLRHTIDGNGIDKMREEADDLTEFFIDR